MQQQQQPNRVNTASPFSTPSSSPGAMPPPDADWMTGSEWSMSGSAQSSRAPSPAFRPPLNRDQLAHIGSILLAQIQAGQIPSIPSPSTTPAPPSESSSSRPASPAVPPPKKKVPRPANAFMLFRSDMIKQGKIPKNVEQRQQNISRVAGQCWNMACKEEKDYWHQQAAEKLAEHMKKYPDYKFSPERKSSRRKATPGGDIPQNSEEYIRYIRERYCGHVGPAVPPPRPRKAKSRRGVDAHDESAPPPMPFSLPPSCHSSPAATPDVPRTASAPPMMAISPEAHLAAMGPHGMPDYSMPPPGPFPPNFHPELFAQFVAQQAFQGDDSTSKVPTFNDPTQAKFTFNHAGDGSAEANLGLAPPYAPATGPSTSQQEGSSRPASPSRWDSLSSYLTPEPLISGDASAHDALNVALGASAAYGTDPNAALDTNELDVWFSTAR